MLVLWRIHRKGCATESKTTLPFVDGKLKGVLRVLQHPWWREVILLVTLPLPNLNHVVAFRRFNVCLLSALANGDFRWQLLVICDGQTIALCKTAESATMVHLLGRHLIPELIFMSG